MIDPLISPAELTADMITRYGQTANDYTIIVGPADDTQQQDGVVSITAAGLPSVEKYTPLTSMRAQIRCLGGTLDTADIVSQSVYRDIHGFVRRAAYQASIDSWFLVHLCNVTAGPSHHWDSGETWEALLFAELLISGDPIITP